MTCTMFSTKRSKSMWPTSAGKGTFSPNFASGQRSEKLGLKFRRLPLPNRSTICWHGYPWRVERPGLFHAIKSLDHNQGKPAQPGALASCIYDWLRSRTHDRQFAFHLAGKRAGLRRRMARAGAAPVQRQ